MDLLAATEERRRKAQQVSSPEERANLGQFLTPVTVANLLASMIAWPERDELTILDPGAGVGGLTVAAVEEALSCRAAKKLRLVAYEIDARLCPLLKETLKGCAEEASSHGVALTWEIRNSDYLQSAPQESFDVIIMNPPYRKIGTGSPERLALAPLVRVSNLYTAFLALASAQLAEGGSLTAITPRSFANGTYHKAFRLFLFGRLSFDRIRIFESRKNLFVETDVLQENIIFTARRVPMPEHVSITISHGIDDPAREHNAPYGAVLFPEDADQILHIPTTAEDLSLAESMAALPCTLSDLGVFVSTGQVVDFRMREHLRSASGSDAVPLIYPLHLRGHHVTWPAASATRKPNALARNKHTESLLLPNETYVLVKRFSTKEEPRRVSATLITPQDLPGNEFVTFENHLNVLHSGGHGLNPLLAASLTSYLNSSFVDRYVRLFSGHTQINAADLRSLRYPSLDELITGQTPIT